MKKPEVSKFTLALSRNEALTQDDMTKMQGLDADADFLGRFAVLLLRCAMLESWLIGCA